MLDSCAERMHLQAAYKGPHEHTRRPAALSVLADDMLHLHLHATAWIGIALPCDVTPVPERATVHGGRGGR